MDLNDLRKLNGQGWRTVGCGVVALAALVGLSGCSHFHHKSSDKYVFVTARKAYLMDRVAAVSNRTGEVTNGEKLVLLERGRRFMKVRSPNGEVGWINDDKVADQAMEDKFDAMRAKYEHYPVIGYATASDEVYMHVSPGVKTDHFFLLQSGDKMTLLKRASMAKPLPPGTALANAAAQTANGGQAAAPAPPAMEDWWLVRNARGNVGWVYSGLVDIEGPDALERYAEGQRMIGAYVLTHVNDPDSGMLNNGQTVTSIPEYVAVLGPYKAGLPYDFNQVRVFTWNVKKHRYETAFSDRNIMGYLPVTISMKTDPYGKSLEAGTPMPSFSYRVLAAGAPVPSPDPETGEWSVSGTITKTYRLEDTVCRRILPPGEKPPEETHPVVETKKKKR
jgi:hypothetical protein